MTKPYAQLARRMTITAMVVALVPLYLLGTAIFFYFDISSQERIREELRTRIHNRANSIQLFLAERTALLEVLTFNANLDDLLTPGRLQEVFSQLNRRSWSFMDLGIIGHDGDHLAYVGPYNLEHQNYKDTQWFREVMTRGVYVSDVFLGKRGVPHFIIAVKHGQGDNPWILRASIDSDVFTKLVQLAQTGSGGDAYIVNREGLYQTPPRFGGQVMDPAKLDLKAVPPGISVTERHELQGNGRLVAYSWLSKEDWLLVIEQDAHERVGAMAVARNVELAILGLGSLVVVGVVLFLVKLLVRQLESADRRRADQDAQLMHSARLVSMGRMAAGVAHEINNPLAAIGELAGLMDDLMDEEFVASYARGPKFKENLAKIQNHVERARAVTHRLLGFARRMEPHNESVDVNAVVKETSSFLERDAMLRGVALNLEMAPELPRVQSDRSQLQQVFLNLLNNAMDAVGDGGHITVTSRLAGGYLEVSVADDGPGIPASAKERIFDPFFTTKDPGQGTGLGLSISHSIMQRLGGSLTFESEPGRGATFLVRIPKTLAE